MITSEALPLTEQPPKVMNGIFQSPQAEIPSIATSLSQGAAVGALLAGLLPMFGMLAHPNNGYNFLLVYYLPVFLGAGMLFGLCEAVLLWACTYILNHRIHPIIRAILGPVLLVTLMWIYGCLFAGSHRSDTGISTTDYLIMIGVYGGGGIILGLVIGSRIQPFFELTRGTTTLRRPLMNAFTGLFLRLIVIFGLMVAMMNLILSTQIEFSRIEFTMSAIAVTHFAIAALIVFARTPFWLLLPSALVINFPGAALLTDVLTPDQVFLRTITFIYLGLWSGFLLCRATVPRKALNLIKRELRYYFE